MHVRYHRIAAVSILATGLVVVLGWGRSMAIESDEIKIVRDRLQGQWVATRIEDGAGNKLEGPEAASCRAEFDGKEAVFRQLIGGIDAEGTAYLEKPNRVDLKLDAGWIVGVFEFDGETLKLALVPFAPLERLGVPSRPRPRQAKAGAGHHYYEFRRLAN